MIRILFTLLITLLMANSSFGQQTVSLTLGEAQDYAVKNGFSVRNSRHDAKSAELQSDELLGIGLPQINASVQYQNYIDLPTSIVPGDFVGTPGQDLLIKFGVPQQMTAGLSVSQLLFDGSWLVGLQASRSYAKLMEQQIKKSELDIRREVAESYHLVLIAQKNVVLLEDGRGVLQETLTQTSALLKEGFVEEQDVDQLQLSLNEWDNRISNARAQLRLTFDLFKFTIGMPLQTDVTLASTSEELMASGSADLTTAEFNPDSSIEVQLAQSGLGMQELNLKNKKAGFLPNMAAFYNLQSQALRREFNFTDTSQPWFPIQLWGVQLNMPILSGGSRSKSVQKAQVEVNRMNETVTYTREAMQLEYNSSRTAYLNATAIYKSSMESYSLSQKILNRTSIKFREGVASSFDVSQATSQSLQSQGAYVQAMLDLMNTKTRFQKVLNQL